MNTYNYAGIDTYDINNGKGFGITLFIQGCPHHCDGCHNPQTWDYNSGKLFDMNIVDDIIEIAKDDNIVRLTISGGEPFANIVPCTVVACRFKAIYPNKSVWVYSGYTYEELQKIPEANNLLDWCDVLVDGPYIKDKRDLSLAFRGSSNQRIIDLKQTREQGTVIICNT